MVTFPYTPEVSAKFFMGSDLGEVVELRKSELKSHKMPPWEGPILRGGVWGRSEELYSFTFCLLSQCLASQMVSFTETNNADCQMKVK